MQSQPSYNPPKQRSTGFYVLWGCGGCACLTVIVVVVGFMLLGWGVKKGLEGLSEVAHKMDIEAKADLKVQDHKMVNKQGEHYIAGTLKNTSPTHTYSTATVEFYLYDKNGKPLLPATAQTEDLKPGATWKFQAPVSDPTVATYKFREVTGFQDMSEDPSLDPATRQKMKEQQAKLREIMKKAQDDSAKPSNP